MAEWISFISFLLGLTALIFALRYGFQALIFNCPDNKIGAMKISTRLLILGLVLVAIAFIVKGSQ